MYALSQGLMGAAALCFGASQAFENKKRVLYYLFWVGYNALLIAHYYCLEAYTAAWLNVLTCLGILLVGVLMRFKKIALSYLLLTVSITASVVIAILTWNTWISLLPMFAAIICFLINSFENIYVQMFGTIAIYVLEIIYLVLFASWVGVVFEAISLALAVFGLVMFLWGKHAENSI